ncbi:MAG TPA: FAD-dependent monooxygenase [Spongiibacteraceae bacterium]|nr:FAD-dependent monooxygenase [Spongiibacteraceae bacterium]
MGVGAVTRSVLISGAGIAGPALAYWLDKAGIRAVIVERAAAPRPGGQAIDIRGVALEVIERMGLLVAARELRTQMRGFSTVDGDGKELWRSENMTLTGGVIDNPDIEILRDDLSNLLIEALPADTEIIFGEDIAQISDGDDGVAVKFASGAVRHFDLVIGADGIGSRVRSWVFGDDAQFLHSLNFALAIFSAPNHVELKDWQVSCRDGAQNCLVYPVRDNRELRVCIGFPIALADVLRLDLDAQKALVASEADGLGWEVPRLLAAMNSAPDFYLGAVAQVKMPSWTQGRVALLGDAAFCPSPFSGQGTSLALVGAYVLARELARTPADFAAAFSRYEARMCPFVDLNQAIVDVSRDGGLSEEEGLARALAVVENAKNAIVLNQ